MLLKVRVRGIKEGHTSKGFGVINGVCFDEVPIKNHKTVFLLRSPTS